MKDALDEPTVAVSEKMVVVTEVVHTLVKKQGSHSVPEFNYLRYLKCTGILKVYWNILELKKCTGISL